MPYLKINYNQPSSVFEIIDLSDDVRCWLDSVHSVIQCESIEVTYTIFYELYLIVDEYAKLCDGWQERINSFASRIHGNPFDPIVGNVILARISGEDFAPLLDSDIEFIKSFL